MNTELANQTIIDKVYDKANNQLELTVVGPRLTTDELMKIKGKQAHYGLDSLKLDINQLRELPANDGDATKELYDYIETYIDKRLSDSHVKNEGIEEQAK